jgi:formiminotetrahydrofolate cyclodeaminase
VSLAVTGVTLASLPTGRLHDALSEVGPGPAGGSAAALATMMASGLVRLVARVSHDWDEAPGIAAQAAALGDRSLALADEDHVAYAHALEQLRTPDRDAALGKALHRAAEVPLRIAETAARDGDDAVRGDAWAAATLAEAASIAAARLVHINLATRPDDELSLRADAAARAATAARDVALQTA